MFRGAKKRTFRFGKKNVSFPKVETFRFADYKYTRRVSDRDDVIYMNQLQWLKSKLIEEERYEEAAKINKCIEDEYNKLKNRKRDYEA